MKRLAIAYVMIAVLVCPKIWAGEEPDRIVMTREEIENTNVRKITDLLNQVPGVNASDSAITVRGSSNVKVFLDGRPINDPTSGHFSPNWNMVSIQNIDRIEIYKGRGGVEYGDDSSGGIVLITTRKVEKLHGDLEAYAGNLGTESYNLNCRADKGPVGVGISGGYEATDGHRPNGDKEKWRGGGKFQWSAGEDAKLMLSADYSGERRGLTGTEKYPTPRSRSEGEMFSSVLTATIKGAKSTTHFNRSETSNTDPDKALDTSTQVTELGEEVSTPISVKEWGKIRCGGGFEWSRATGKQFASQEENEYWFFASKSFECDMLPLTLTTGIRSIFYSEFGEAINPEVMVRYDREVYAVQCSWTRTNNTPSFRKRYNETSTTKPNPSLTMENADNFNLSFVFQPHDRFLASLSPFYSQISNRITYVRGEEGIGQYENFGKVTYKGAELSLDWKVSSALSLKSHYMYLEAKDENTGYWLPLKERHRVGMDVIWTPREDLSINFSAKYLSKQYARSNNTGEIPEYNVEDIRCEYTRGALSIFGEVDNMFDKSYYYTEGYPGAPRTWIVGMNCRF